MSLDTTQDFSSIEEFSDRLKSSGCSLCYLGHQSDINGIVVFRGNPDSRHMIIGEAPGAREDACGLPFSGPAGIKMDEWFRAVQLDTDRDFYVANVIKCRPKAPLGSGKQNITPKVEGLRACRPYILREIELINPTLIVLQGLSAVKSLLPNFRNSRMGDIAGRFLTNSEFPGVRFFPMYHAAALLHAQGSPAYQPMRRATWEHVQTIKRWIDRNERQRD